MAYSRLLILCLFCYSCTALRAISLPNEPFPIRKAYSFHRGSWVENIAVRPNGQLLLTRLDTSELYSLDFESQDPHPILVYRFPNVLSLTGIVEFAPDVFAVSAGNYTLASGPTPGSWSVWRVDLSDWSTTSPNETLTLAGSQVSKIANVPDAVHLKGMTQLSERYVLMSDFSAGFVYRLDVTTGAYRLIIANSLTVAVPQPIFGTCGINGLHVREGHLYFTNTGQNIFAKVPIYADGTPAGTASIVAYTAASTDYFDGFAFGAHSAAYLVTGSGNTVVRLSRLSGPQVKIAGQLDSLLLAEPDRLRFRQRGFGPGRFVRGDGRGIGGACARQVCAWGIGRGCRG